MNATTKTSLNPVHEPGMPERLVAYATVGLGGLNPVHEPGMPEPVNQLVERKTLPS